MFKSNTRFKVMLRCLLEDLIIDKLLKELQEVKKLHEEDRKYRMDRIHLELLLVSLIDFPEKKIYFRINSYIEDVVEGDLINICVLKSWYYKRSLFISGKVEQ